MRPLAMMIFGTKEVTSGMMSLAQRCFIAKEAEPFNSQPPQPSASNPKAEILKTPRGFEGVGFRVGFRQVGMFRLILPVLHRDQNRGYYNFYEGLLV